MPMQKLRAANFASFLDSPMAAVCFVRSGDIHSDVFLDRLAAQAGTDVAVGAVDVDVDADLAADFDVAAVPTLAVFKQRHLAFLEAGALEAAALRTVLDAVRSAPVPKTGNKAAKADAGLKKTRR
jgi:thioredoxin-like negative regulator of GroEL